MNKPAKHRYQVLDSLRGLCACMVVLFHFHTTGWISNWPLVRNSWMFVDFFFVLSGFVIATAFRRRLADGLPIAAFMGLRLGRIYPVHLFVTGLFVALQLVLLAKGSGKAFQGDMSWGGLLASLTFTQTFLLQSGVAWNAPSWSIAVEMWIYLLFAVLFRWFRSRGSLAVVCALIAGASCADIAGFHAGNMDDVYAGAIFRCAYGFALGVIGAEFYPLLRGRGAFAATALEFVALCGAGAFIAIVGTAPLSLLAPPLFLALILIFAQEGGAVSFALKTRLPLLLGECSYSIYMVHLFVLYRIFGLIAVLHRGSSRAFLICENDSACSATGSPWLADALIVPVLATVIAAAWMLRHFVESPCERWAKHALYRGQQPVVGR
jgi:peptidoglycan/LPS O-acetylase OafA/YrhL